MEYYFYKKNQLLITEKSGNLILADLKNQKLKKINHNLKVLVMAKVVY